MIRRPICLSKASGLREAGAVFRNSGRHFVLIWLLHWLNGVGRFPRPMVPVLNFRFL
jgi:hypothetical protein